MIRLVNQFDSSEHLPSSMIASSGGACSSTSCSCSCIVTTVLVCVVSARMTPRLANTGARTPKRAWQRIALSAVIIPLVILLFILSVLAALSDEADLGKTGVMGVFMTPLLYIVYLVYISKNTVQRKKFIWLHILLFVAWFVLCVVEMAVWMNIHG